MSPLVPITSLLIGRRWTSRHFIIPPSPKKKLDRYFDLPSSVKSVSICTCLLITNWSENYLNSDRCSTGWSLASGFQGQVWAHVRSVKGINNFGSCYHRHLCYIAHQDIAIRVICLTKESSTWFQWKCDETCVPASSWRNKKVKIAVGNATSHFYLAIDRWQ